MDLQALIHNNFLLKVIAAVIEIAVGFALGPWVRRMIMRMQHRGIDPGVLTFSASLANIGIRLIAVIIALAQIGVNISVAVGAFSAIGLGISLALKENMSNVAGGMQILITKPFVVGDYIQMGDQEGTVKGIELMFTTLQTFNNQEIVMPNSLLASSVLTNYSHYPTRRLMITVPVAPCEDYGPFRSALMDIMEGDSRVLRKEGYKTVVNGFTDQGMGMEINMICYAKNDDYWDVRFALMEQVQKARSAMHLDPPKVFVQICNEGQNSSRTA